jgi:hypothetical protein
MPQLDPNPLPPADTPAPPQPSPHEEPTPMLDVHPAHHAANSWRDFFIHIATIVLGLLIAVSLEQTVEYFHHRLQATEARELLRRELEVNRQTLEDNDYSLRMHEKHLTAALAMLAQLRTHTLPPDAHFITNRSWSPMDASAWKTARESGAAAYLTQEEQSSFDLSSWDAELFNSNSEQASLALGRATMVTRMGFLAINPASAKLPTDDKPVLMGRSGDKAAEAAWALRAADVQQLSRLTPVQIDRLELAIQSSLYDDQDLLNTCLNLRRRYILQSKEK